MELYQECHRRVWQLRDRNRLVVRRCRSRQNPDHRCTQARCGVGGPFQLTLGGMPALLVGLDEVVQCQIGGQLPDGCGRVRDGTPAVQLLPGLPGGRTTSMPAAQMKERDLVAGRPHRQFGDSRSAYANAVEADAGHAALHQHHSSSVIGCTGRSEGELRLR